MCSVSKTQVTPPKVIWFYGSRSIGCEQHGQHGDWMTHLINSLVILNLPSNVHDTLDFQQDISVAESLINS